jgi:hypothetical protein
MTTSENKVLRKIFTPKKEEAIGEWRKFHIKYVHNLHFSRNAIKVAEEDGKGTTSVAGIGTC